MAKVIEVRKTDSFRISTWGLLHQCRGGRVRVIPTDKEPGAFTDNDRPEWVLVPDHHARAWLTGLGFTITEEAAQPQPSYPVVRVAELTHGLASRTGSGLVLLGTEDQCKKDWEPEDHYIVRLDWTGVGQPDTPAKPEPLAGNANYNLEDGRKPDFKVGDVVRGRVVGRGWGIRHPMGADSVPYTADEKLVQSAILHGYTITNIALVEVEARQ